jgi:hypothetical protein
MWDAVVESLDQLKAQKGAEGQGSGCILAHCMGLGKTLSVCIIGLFVWIKHLNRLNLIVQHCDIVYAK